MRQPDLDVLGARRKIGEGQRAWGASVYLRRAACRVDTRDIAVRYATLANQVAIDAEVVIPSTTSRRAPIPYDRDAYKARNLVERLRCRLEDFRSIATGYEKLARNVLAAALIAATITYWCN